MKKIHWIALFVTLGVLAALALAFVFLSRPSGAVQEDANTLPTRPPEKVNVIPVEERPYASLAPSADGRTLTLMIGELKKPAAEGEFEIDYQFGNNLQNGAFGMIDVDELPGGEYDILLGSCSAGGKCSYDEDVTGGTLLLRFDDPEAYALKNEWVFIENQAEETLFGSRDAKFGIEGDGLESVSYAIIMQSPGLPENVETVALSAPYTVQLATPATGPFTVRIRLNAPAEAAQMLGWDGTAWEELETEVLDQVAVAEVATLYEAFVVVETSE